MRTSLHIPGIRFNSREEGIESCAISSDIENVNILRISPCQEFASLGTLNFENRTSGSRY